MAVRKTLDRLSKLENLEEEDISNIGNIDEVSSRQNLTEKTSAIDEIKNISRHVVFRVKSATIEAIKPENIYDFKNKAIDIKQEEEKLEKLAEEEKKQQIQRISKQDESKKSFCFKCKQSKYLSSNFYKNNVSFLLSIVIYILLSIFFVLIQLLALFPKVPWYLAIARAAGILIDFNSCLIILLVLRRLHTWLRNTVFGNKFSVIDDFSIFHKVIGIWLFILIIVHTIGQIINYCKLLFQ
jgi:hypothetical protein